MFLKVDNKYPVFVLYKHLYNYNFKFGFKNFKGLTVYPFIFILPEYKSDTSLLEHEKQHVRQFFNYPVIFPFIYVFSKFWRQKFEIEAYRKQLEFIEDKYKQVYIENFASCLCRYYGLDITKEQAIKELS